MEPAGTARPSRRIFLKAGTMAAAGGWRPWAAAAYAESGIGQAPLTEFGYGDVLLRSEPHEAQLRETQEVLMSLSEDALLKPLRQMSGMTAPGEDLGGWYRYDPEYDYRRNFDDGFAPACTFGQWISALARAYAITGDAKTREKVLRLNSLYARTITGDFYARNRFPAYSYDKLLLGLLDSHTHAQDPRALEILEQTTNAALPHLPGWAVPHNARWRMDKPEDDESWTWDESYTLPENLFLASQRGGGRRYYDLAMRYLEDRGWFDPLSRNQNVLNGRHAYSYVNSLNSALMAYLVAGSRMHLRAGQNAFAMLEEQSYATGGWGPDERLRDPESDDLYESLTRTHSSFETPCGSYAHFKLTRYLLRVTRDARYGDSMERMMYNTVLGAMPLQRDGDAFYYSDYNLDGQRVYHQARWPCCSGTLPQVAADYRINTYLRGPQAVYVNLYLPSTLRWTEQGAALTLTGEGDYPYEDRVHLRVTSSRPAELTMNFRIPEWAKGASIFVNGVNQRGLAVPGRFASVRREWRSGDRVDLELPLAMRLEPVNRRHPNVVALLRGPLVLMAVRREGNRSTPRIARSELLGARRVGRREWQVNAADGPVAMVPFTELGERHYTTYMTAV